MLNMQIHPTLRDALRSVRSGFVGIVMLSAMLNVLALTTSIYLLLIYDRVLPSMSVPTLVSLAVIVTVLLAFNAMFDALRLRLLAGIASIIDRRLSLRLQSLEVRAIGARRADTAGIRPMRDLDRIRGYLSSLGPAAIIDLPWVLFFIAILFMLHPLLGLTTLGGAVILAGLTILNERATFRKVQEANAASQVQAQASDQLRRHTDTMVGLGMTGRMIARADVLHGDFVDKQRGLAEQSASFGAMGRSFRLFVQSGVLSVGALLAIDGQATGGIVFAASILAGRALAPVDQALANWRNFSGARQSWTRLNIYLSRFSDPDEPSVDLPEPKVALAVDRLVVAPPGSDRIALANAQFVLNAGDAVAVIGPSGSGKSTLARTLANIWQPSRGSVRLDGAEYDKWRADVLGHEIGYLPQTVDLFPGTIAENIARFHPDASSDAIIAAARAAGVHEFILGQPDGYDTVLVDDGDNLSGGQRQRLGLARALYGDPFVLVLDEPSANLDPTGEAALASAIRAVRARGGIAIIVTHSMPLVKSANFALLLRDGKQQMFGDSEQVLAQIASARNDRVTAKRNLTVVAGDTKHE